MKLNIWNASKDVTAKDCIYTLINIHEYYKIYSYKKIFFVLAHIKYIVKNYLFIYLSFHPKLQNLNHQKFLQLSSVSTEIILNLQDVIYCFYDQACSCTSSLSWVQNMHH